MRNKNKLKADRFTCKYRLNKRVSFGSTLKIGKDVLEVIKLVPGYAPSNTNLTVLDFTSFVDSINTENSFVAEKLEE